MLIALAGRTRDRRVRSWEAELGEICLSRGSVAVCGCGRDGDIGGDRGAAAAGGLIWERMSLPKMLRAYCAIQPGATCGKKKRKLVWITDSRLNAFNSRGVYSTHIPHEEEPLESSRNKFSLSIQRM